MKRTIVSVAFLLVFGLPAFAQQSQSETPATKEDIQKYLEVTHSREMMAKMVDAMVKPMHDMIHAQYLKDKDKLPPDFEARVNKSVDESLKSFPWNEMLDAMIPVYQKHWTKGDVEALTAFYSTPTGQKILREMPQVVAEAMQSAMPLMQKHMEAMQERMKQEVTAMLKESDQPSKSKAKPSDN